MGPRSHERGKARCVQPAIAVGSASMGPRSHERGKSTCSPRTALAVASRFNGAALSTSAEMRIVVGGQASRPTRFNGAALSRARKCDAADAHGG